MSFKVFYEEWEPGNSISSNFRLYVPISSKKDGAHETASSVSELFPCEKRTITFFIDRFWFVGNQSSCRILASLSSELLVSALLPAPLDVETLGIIPSVLMLEGESSYHAGSAQ